VTAPALLLCNGRERLTRLEADARVRRGPFKGARAYSCVECGDWHVGRSSRQRRMKVRRR
jgi:hypothetical protein